MKTFNVKEIAEMLDVSQEAVRRWIRSGKLEAIQHSRKDGNIVSKEALNMFLVASPKLAKRVTKSTPLPPMTAPSVSTTCLIGGTSVNRKRNAALAAAYASSKSALEEYRKKVVKTIDKKRRGI